MNPFAGVPFNEWHVTLGAGAHLGRLGVVLLMTVAALAMAFSALSLIEERHGRGWLLLLLRAAGVAACLATALEPTIEQRQVVHVPNHVAVVVDTSRSMEVRPPDGGRSRAERAHALLEGAAPTLGAWERDGHHVDLYSFGESLAPATPASLAAAPAGDATRIGEALGDLRARYAGRDLGGVVITPTGSTRGASARGRSTR